MKNKIYTYKYMWHCTDKPTTMCFRYVSGIKQEHDEFIQSLNDDENIEMCSRVYVNEIDCDIADRMEFIKGGDINEKSE